jgi:phage gp29-like protein
MKTKASMVQGEPLPPRKFLVTRFHPRYDDPYSGREALFNGVYFPVKFRRIIMMWAMQFLEKYGMPWLDVTMEGGLQQDRLTEIVSTIQKTYQDGIIAHPDNTKIEKMDMDDSKSVESYAQWLDVLNREIDMCILGTNLTSEVKGGSFAAATAHMGVRDDIIQEDIRMVEATFNQLIEWIAWFNFPADMDLPKFKLYKSEPPTLERAQIDQATTGMGVKLKKEYFARTYGYNEEEFDLIDPQPTSVTIGGEEVPVKKSTDGSLSIGPDDAKTIQDATIETKDQVSNSQSKDAVVKAQGKGSY